MPEDIDKDPRVYFAAERTLLAWIRTGLAILASGFAVSRFGLYLREIASDENSQISRSPGVFVWGGAALVALGVSINIFAVIGHLRVIRALAAGTWISGRPSREGIALALLLAIVGIATLVYLILVH
jgi:putative membrane protein